jgi:GAF domain-containing protein
MHTRTNGSSSYMRDPRRLSVLRRSGLLESSPTDTLDRWTRLGAKLLRVPVSLVSLVEPDRQVFAGQVGLAEPWASKRQTPITHSFCQHVVETRAPFAVQDAHNDSRVAGNLAIRDLGVVGYLGVPLEVGGEVLGSLCAITSEPRAWTAEDVEALATLAFGVGAAVAERLRMHSVPAALDELGSQFGALAEPARLRLVVALGNGERTVGELAEATSAAQPNTSRHLAVLLAQGIVSRRREGVRTYYRLSPGVLHRLRDVVWALLDRAGAAA